MIGRSGRTGPRTTEGIDMTATKTTKATKATKTTKTAAKRTGSKATTGRGKLPAPARAIGDAAVELERDIVAALRKELKNLRKTVETIQHDVHKALVRVEDALEDVAASAPSANGSAPKKAGHTSPTRKSPAKRPAKRSAK